MVFLAEKSTLAPAWALINCEQSWDRTNIDDFESSPSAISKLDGDKLNDVKFYRYTYNIYTSVIKALYIKLPPHLQIKKIPQEN